MNLATARDVISGGYVRYPCTFGPPPCAHLAPDDEGPEALLGRGWGDDKAQPHRENDAEGDGGGCQPARHSQARVHARHPVRPAAETNSLLSISSLPRVHARQPVRPAAEKSKLVSTMAILQPTARGATPWFAGKSTEASSMWALHIIMMQD